MVIGEIVTVEQDTHFDDSMSKWVDIYQHPQSFANEMIQCDGSQDRAEKIIGVG